MISRRDLLQKSGVAGLGGVALAALGYLFPELRRASAQEPGDPSLVDATLGANVTAVVDGLANVTTNLAVNATVPG